MGEWTDEIVSVMYDMDFLVLKRGVWIDIMRLGLDWMGMGHYPLPRIGIDGTAFGVRICALVYALARKLHLFRLGRG